MAPSKGNSARLYKGANTGTAMTTEAMTDSGDGLRFRITNRIKRYWDDTATFTVYDNGTPVATSGYTIEYPGGEVVFTSTRAGRTITVTGAYFSIDKAYRVYTIESELTCDLKEITDLEDKALKNYPTGVTSMKLTITGRHEDATWFNLLGGVKFPVVFSESGTYSSNKIDSGKRFEFYGRLESDKIDGASAKDVLGDTVSIISEGQVYIRSD